jgi:hypothetical protein
MTPSVLSVEFSAGRYWVQLRPEHRNTFPLPFSASKPASQPATRHFLDGILSVLIMPGACGRQTIKGVINAGAVPQANPAVGKTQCVFGFDEALRVRSWQPG